MDSALTAAARRLLDRYLVEVVERFGLCPWAEPARRRGELRVEICEVDEAAAAVQRIAADPAATVGMVVLAASRISSRELAQLRDGLLRDCPDLLIADFHPEASLELASPARLVPALRRSPDPMLQIVRGEVMAAIKRVQPPATPLRQAAMLSGRLVVAPPVEAEVAARNLATVAAAAEEFAAAIAAIHADRDATYGALAPSPPRVERGDATDG